MHDVVDDVIQVVGIDVGRWNWEFKHLKAVQSDLIQQLVATGFDDFNRGDLAQGIQDELDVDIAFTQVELGLVGSDYGQNGFDVGALLALGCCTADA